MLVDGVKVKGTKVDVQGIDDAVVLDADGDTSLSAASDDRIDVEISGANDFTITFKRFNISAGSSVVADGSTVLPLIPIAAQQSIVGSGAANLTTYFTDWLTSGPGQNLTLANGEKGQLKKILVNPVTTPNTVTITPASFSGGTQITSSTAGDYVILQFDGTNWVALELGNDASGTGGPTIS
jgi:hypothetical protein